MVGRRVDREEALQEFSEALLPIYLLLHYHLQYGVLKVEVGIVGVLHHRHAVADPTAGSDRRRCELGWRDGVAWGEGRGGVVIVGGGEGRPVPRAGGGGVVVFGGFGFGFGREDVGELRPPATAAKVDYRRSWEQLSP